MNPLFFRKTQNPKLNFHKTKTEPQTEPLKGGNEKPADFQRVSKFVSGERGIRTPGASQHGSFQDYCNRPLYHLSSASIFLKAGAKVRLFYELTKF